MIRRRGILAALFAGPAIITTPGLLMPISTLTFPTYGPLGLITDDMIAAEFNRRIQQGVPAAMVDGWQQSHTEMAFDRRDLTLSMEAFAARYINPSVAVLQASINQRGGKLLIGRSLATPQAGAVEGWGVNTRNGVSARVVHTYDIGTDTMLMRLDVLHS